MRQRVPVRRLTAELLAQAPLDEKGKPQGLTHLEIACAVYATEEPTAAQESAVRRAVAGLVSEGLAERRRDGLRRPGSHKRRSSAGGVFPYINPTGVTAVRRRIGRS